MTIGAALVLIAVGAILRFAVQTVSTHGFDIHTIGDILMGVGIVGLILWLVIWAPRARGHRRAVPQDPPRDAEPVPDPYRDPYRRDGRYPYRDDEYPTAEYPTTREDGRYPR